MLYFLIKEANTGTLIIIEDFSEKEAIETAESYFEDSGEYECVEAMTLDKAEGTGIDILFNPIPYR